MNTAFLGKISISLAGLSLLCLALLHVLSPEITPSWHMVSEYAFGNYGGVLSVFFFAWGAAYLILAWALLPMAQGWAVRIALLLMVITGMGALMGGLFDIRHPLHGLAFGIGVPFFPIAAFMIGRNLPRRYVLPNPKLLAIARHAPWLSLILMGIAMAVFINGLKTAGLFHPEAAPHLLTSLPDDVPQIAGYFNRLLIVAYLASLLILANAARQVQQVS